MPRARERGRGREKCSEKKMVFRCAKCCINGWWFCALHSYLAFPLHFSSLRTVSLRDTSQLCSEGWTHTHTNAENVKQTGSSVRVVELFYCDLSTAVWRTNSWCHSSAGVKKKTHVTESMTSNICEWIWKSKLHLPAHSNRRSALIWFR